MEARNIVLPSVCSIEYPYILHVCGYAEFYIKSNLSFLAFYVLTENCLYIMRYTLCVYCAFHVPVERSHRYNGFVTYLIGKNKLTLTHTLVCRQIIVSS